MIGLLKKILNFLIPSRLKQWYILKMDRRTERFEMTLTDKEREEAVDAKYFYARKKHLDFENPVLFTEKVQWYKLYYGHPDLSRIVCKYNFKKYIAEKLGSDKYTIPLYGAWKNVDDIDFNSLPSQFVLKSNCYFGGMNIEIVRDKSSVDFEKLKEEMKSWLDPKNTLLKSACRAYYDVTPMIIAEEYMEQLDNQLYDYKFFCFDGKPCYIYVSVDHFASADHPIVFYDMDWNQMDVRYKDNKICEVEKPKFFDQMVEFSKVLSKDFPFVRVDFFETNEQLYLAEMTFYPGAYGSYYTPESFDKEMGDRFVLPPKQPLGRKHRRDLKI